MRCAVTLCLACLCTAVSAKDPPSDARLHRRHWLWTVAHEIPKRTTSEGSGYFSIVEGRNGKLYIGTAKYRHNAYLVEFDPASGQMEVVVDAHREIGTDATGFAAQAKIHTRNNVGASGKIYFATKQGYPQKDEQRSEYLGGYPMVYDPATGKTRVYPIPIEHQGVISVTPDESRGIAYISTCSDERPVESAHFMILDLKSGEYRDLLDTRHMYAFIVRDARARAYHPVLGGDVARYDPEADQLRRIRPTLDAKPLDDSSLLAHPKSHPINWEVSPDRNTLYAVAMSGNQLYSFDLTKDERIAGKSLGPLIAGADKTDCRAMCVDPQGVVWAGVAATFKRRQFLHLVSYRPGDEAPVDHGPLAISNDDYTQFNDDAGKPLKWHHGVHRPFEPGPLLPRYTIMGICAAGDGTVYLTTLYPFTLHAVRIPRLAGLTTVYRHNSHSDMLFSRLLQTDTLDFKGERPPAHLASLHVLQKPDNDLSRSLGERHGVPRFDSVQRALTLGGEQLAVDGVLLVAEHGEFPESPSGQIQYPKRQLFDQAAELFRRSQRTAPVFVDKMLADTWEDSKHIYDTAREMKIPLMAGSSLPVLWRRPPADVRRGAKLREITAVSYHRLDTYGFHALEMVQCLAERRAGGETGVAWVQCLEGDAVWEAGKCGLFDRQLLDDCLARIERPLPKGKTVEQLVKRPVLFHIRYQDGLRANILTLDGALIEWSAAWRYEDGSTESTLFWTQEARPFMHFTYLLAGVDKMMQTGRPTWPAERTLLTSGLLDALLQSRLDSHKQRPTPHLRVRYDTAWQWRQPPPPPPGRPIPSQ